MQNRIVMVFDIGTQSLRAMLVNQRGVVLAKQKIEHQPAYYSPVVDWAEQDADFYYENLCLASRALKDSHPTYFAQVEAVSVTTIRDTLVCLDKDGKPLRRAILWLDKRMASGKAALPPHTRLLMKSVGMEKTAHLQFRKSHCNWIREHEPEIWARTAKCVFLSTYLLFKLTGRLADAIPSVVGHLPFDMKKRRWQGPFGLTRPVFPVEKEKLFELVESGQVIGKIIPQMAADSGLEEGLPVFATGSDKACEVLGLGCISPDRAAVGLGTTATITYTSKKYVEPQRFIPPFCGILPNSYNPEVEIYRGYWLISWFKREFARHEVVQAEAEGRSPEEVLNEKLKEIPPGCDGLIFQPYFTPNVNMPNARGAVIGFSDVHTRIHLYRAIIEGINYALMDGLRLMEKRSGIRFKELTLGGGGSQSDEICQITANMFGIPVVRTQTYEATGLGSALVSFVGLGVYTSYEEAVAEMVVDCDRFEPDMKIHQIYQELYHDIFKHVFERLAPLYHKLQHMRDRIG